MQPLFPEQMDQAVYEGIDLSEHCMKACSYKYLQVQMQ